MIETIEITKQQDNFVWGKMANLSFTAKVLDKKDKIYGIDGGRVIKLEIKDNYKNEDVVLYVDISVILTPIPVILTPRGILVNLK